MIGFESMVNCDDEFLFFECMVLNFFGVIVEDRVWYKMKISIIVDYYYIIYKIGYFVFYDLYFDCFMLFYFGLGYFVSSYEWEEIIFLLLEMKVLIISIGYMQFDMEWDVEWVNKIFKGEFDVFLELGENMFCSLRWDLNDMDF